MYKTRLLDDLRAQAYATDPSIVSERQARNRANIELLRCKINGILHDQNPEAIATLTLAADFICERLIARPSVAYDAGVVSIPIHRKQMVSGDQSRSRYRA